MDFRSSDLAKLSSLTKYPSIPTYHALGERGRLTEELLVDFTGDDVLVTEKIDGTNARVIFCSDQYESGSAPECDYLIGSREEILHARGDRVFNPAQGIVEAVRHVADRCKAPDSGGVFVLYGEVYGGKVTAASKRYRGDEETRTGFRLFDVAMIAGDVAENLLAGPREEIAAWRDGGGQRFLSEPELHAMAQRLDVQMTPRIDVSRHVPRDVSGTMEWLRNTIGETRAALGDAPGEAEGVVIRTPDRKKISKLRFEDYRRTLRGSGER